MKNLKKIIIATFCIGTLLGLVGCKNLFNDENIGEQTILEELKIGKYESKNVENKIEFYEDNTFLIITSDNMNYVGTYMIDGRKINCSIEKKNGINFATENMKIDIEFECLNDGGIKYNQTSNEIENIFSSNSIYNYVGEYEKRLMARDLLQEENNTVISSFFNNREKWSSGEDVKFCFIDLDRDLQKELLVQDINKSVPSTFVYKYVDNKIEKAYETNINLNGLVEYIDSEKDNIFVTTYDEEISNTEEITVIKEYKFSANEFSEKELFKEKRFLKNSLEANNYENWILEYYVGNTNVQANKYISEYKNYFDKLSKEELDLYILDFNEWNNFNDEKKLTELYKAYGD